MILMAPALEAHVLVLLGPAIAEAAGVQHIALISEFDVNHDEQALASNICEQNTIYLAAGDGKTSFILVEDIAAAAWAAFQQQFAGSEIDLTGLSAFGHSEAAKALGLVLATLQDRRDPPLLAAKRALYSSWRRYI